MTARALSDALSTPGETRAWYTAVVLAALAHVISLSMMQTLQHAPAAARTLTTAVQLLAPTPAPPPPTAAEEPPPPAPAPAPKARPKSKQPPPAPPPAATHAPALLTSEATPGRAAPVRFVSDPHGRSYASGRVAVGGVAASNEPVAARASSQDELVTPADQLQRQPLWTGGDCQGYFPEQAQVELGQVSLIAVVRADGSIARLDVSHETPPQSGFARAARACLMQHRFSPALGRDGRPTPARTQINLRFSR